MKDINIKPRLIFNSRMGLSIEISVIQMRITFLNMLLHGGVSLLRSQQSLRLSIMLFIEFNVHERVHNSPEVRSPMWHYLSCFFFGGEQSPRRIPNVEDHPLSVTYSDHIYHLGKPPSYVKKEKNDFYRIKKMYKISIDLY